MKKYQPDILYKGMTRSAMKWGMPYKYILFAMVIYVIAITKLESMVLAFVLPPVLWLIGLELGRRDPRLIEILIARARLPGITKRVKKFWKTRTYGAY